MKFVCLGYGEDKQWDAMSEDQRNAIIEDCFRYDDELRKNGHWIDGGQALQAARTAKTLRLKNGKVMVTDGPYAETKEQLGGTGVLEARDIDHAVELISRHPGLRMGGSFEIRSVDEKMNEVWESRHPRPQIFVNLPVKNLNQSIAFFTKLGFQFNPQFTDETATCMIVSDVIFVMLLTEAKFKEFTPNAICDATRSNEALVCLSLPSRGAVDDMVRNAIAAGGKTFADPKDYGFMYQHSFQDPDGHVWELIHMDPKHVHKT